MFITPEQVTRVHAGMTYDLATTLYEQQQDTETSLVEQNAADFIAECDLIGIESQPDDSERA